jgi:glycerol uptake facilitator-like aquaporin
MFLTGLAELIGTFILVFVGCMGCIGSLGVLPKHLQITLTFGLAVMVAIQVSRLVEYLKTIVARPVPPRYWFVLGSV